MDELNFKDCVLELQKNNLDVFDKFYESIKNPIFYNILGLIKNYELAEDLLQETFVTFLKNIQKVDVNSSIVGYLMTISRNLTLDYLRKQNRERELDEVKDVVSTYDESHLDQEILLNKIEKILKDKEFQIFTLHVLSELSFEEISKLVHRPLGTVLWSYNNSIKKLQKELEHEKD